MTNKRAAEVQRDQARQYIRELQRQVSSSNFVGDTI